jgi:hypothetical protein
MHPLTFIKKGLKVGGCIHHFIFLFICSLFAAFINSASFADIKNNPYSGVACGDFLSDAHQKPPALTFETCVRTNDAQLAVLKSTYSVSGKKADIVEKYLVEQYSMPKLRFVCCGWESSNRGGFFNYKNYSMAVTMYTSETLVTDRNHWAEIPKFYVDVILYLEQP